MTRWLKDHPLFTAVLEHCLRGGVSALLAAYASGKIVWDGTVNVQEFMAWLLIFVGGFVTSLLLSLGIHASTGTGPALNRAESFETKTSVRRRREQRGVAELTVIAVCVVIITVFVVAWAFGFHPHH